jgi:Fe-S-cluster containining protein
VLPDDAALPAGGFSAWLARIESAIDGRATAEVPCHGCTACCTSSQFVHIGPDETDTLAHIPSELLFPAPRLPRGHVVLGYDERGHCPMLVDNRCTIYEHRPRACRTYDCRVFPAAAVSVDEDKPLIAERVRRWRFDHPTESDRIEHEAVIAAAVHLRRRVDGPAPANATELAVRAIQVHRAFLPGREAGQP